MTKTLERQEKYLSIALVGLFIFVKLAVHFVTYDNYELHRDAYLYYAQSEHLAWGFVAVPPSIAVVGKIATALFGNTTFALRFFPAIIGALNLVIIGLMVRELKGKSTALILASLAFILSPAYLHTNALFQPVSFNQFYWLLASYLILILINRQDPKIWPWIALVFALAFLNKYSIVFFAFAFIISLLISQHRQLFLSKYFFLALIGGIILILPNLLWQMEHNWPVLRHMAELQRTQLVHVRFSDFISLQFLMNMQALPLWLSAVLLLLFHKNEKQYRLFGTIFLAVMIVLILGRGKPYYTLGVFPAFFVFGACFFEKYIPKFRLPMSLALIAFMFISLYVSLRFDGIPFVTFEGAVQKNAYRWEDGVNHDIPQDLADMTGWTQVGDKTVQVYRGLADSVRANCAIYCEHYGQGGAVMFRGKKQGIPQPISFNGSFPFWSPDSLNKEWLIWVHTDVNNDFDAAQRLPELFAQVELKATIVDKYFRENGTQIYLCRQPNAGLKAYYKQRITRLKAGLDE